jgi:hypothetical protein
LICDFGLSRRLLGSTGQLSEESDDGLYQSSGGVMPWRSCAPESLSNLVFSMKSDMWMLGTVLALFTVKNCSFEVV